MPGDYSRFTDDPKKRFSSLLMQQGRVQLDSDWNELADILTRRDRMHIFDVMGRAAIPRATTPNGFRISAAGADLAIGAGHAYVDGIVAEALATDPLTYATQPFWPDPTPLTSLAGSGVAYLDVWEREITALEDPALLDPALGGVDTATRTKTIWQVKIAVGANCNTAPDTLVPPSPGRLSTKLDAPPDPPDPCLLPESGGLRDVENRFYRVEVHGNSSKFKFSRDPVASNITNIAPPVAGKTTVTVQRVALDAVLRFNPGDWVEVTSDRHVLDGTPGLMAQIDHIEESTREIFLDRTIAASETSAAFPARLIRWDQRASASVTLDGDGLITATPGAFQPLEAGVQVKFGAGVPKHGDTWRFATRVADGSIDLLTDAPPRATIHHVCTLAPVSNLGTSEPHVDGDCRILWPPDVGPGEDCECAVCVSADEHNNGTKTIQQAILQAKPEGGKVCLKPGAYFVRETIVIQNAILLSLTGHGQAVLFFSGTGPVIRIENAIDVVVEDLVIVRPGLEDDNTEGVGIEVRNSLLDVTVRRCLMGMQDERAAIAGQTFPNHGICVQLEGIVQNVRVEENFFAAAVGVGNIFSNMNELPLILGLGIEIFDNLCICGQSGVALAGFLTADVERNWIVSGLLSINCVGITAIGGQITIDDNHLFAVAAVGFTTSSTTVSNNTITSLVLPDPNSQNPGALRALQNGIIFGASLINRTLTMPIDPEAVKILGNRIVFMIGNGVFISGAVGSAMIKQNSIGFVGGAGIATAPKAHIRQLSIENNQIVAAGIAPQGDDLPAGGVVVIAADELEIAHNSVQGVIPLRQNEPSHGILVGRVRRLRIDANSIAGVRPGVSDNISTAIEVLIHAAAEIVSNNVLWRAADDPNAAEGLLELLRIRGGRSSQFKVLTFRLPGFVFKGKDAIAEFVFAGNRAIVLRSPEQALIVRNNVLQMFAPSFVPIVEISVRGTASFGGNDGRVVVDDSEVQRRPAVAVFMQSETAIVDANHVFGAQRFGLDIQTTNDDGWTILGNIVEGDIQINSASLPDPWAKLNRRI